MSFAPRSPPCAPYSRTSSTGSPSRTRRPLRAALGQAERLATLASDLLDLARVDAGQAPLSTTRVPVLRLLERAVAEAQVAGRDVRYDVRAVDAHRPGRPGEAAPTGRQPGRQRLPTQSRRWGRADHGPGHGHRLATRGRRRWAGHSRRRPRPRLRAVRDTGGRGGRRRHGPRTRHRALGHRPPRRHDPLRRSGAARHRCPGARRPPFEPRQHNHVPRSSTRSPS